MGRNRVKELERIVSTIGAYLDRAASDPSLPLSYDGIQAQTGVSRGHLSRRKEPEILALVSRIAHLQGARRDGSGASAAEASQGASPTLATTSAPAPSAAHGALSDAALKTIMRRDLDEIARLQQMWLGRHGRGAAVDDAPLALYDADVLLHQLRAAIERLRPVVGEWNQRRGSTLMDDAAKPTEAPALSLF